MAITFLEKRKRQQYLIPVFTGVIFIIIIVLWQGFLRQEEPLLPEEILKQPVKKIEIDFAILQIPVLEELQPFAEISSLGEEVGRENPFTPY